MCGIVGTLGDTFSADVLHTLAHRGPDGHGVEKIAVGACTVLLGHTRLAILDLSPAGHQPMASRDGRWWVIFNGEIYNHLELRRSLDGLFRGHSDTETLVELLARQGIEATLRQLNGMFAFAALDVRKGRLYLARDPFGIKPLYYSHRKNCFSFASEVRALKALGVDGGIDPTGVRQFLTLRYIPSPHTMWRDIRRLPSGHLLCLDLASHSLQLIRYIEPVCERFQGTLADAVHAYQEQLLAAVRRQLLADVPVGVLLSGGVDSALVAAMARDAGRALPCFTVGFGGKHAECEIKDAMETAHVLDLQFHSVTVTPAQLRDALPLIVRAVEEPLGTTSVMPMWYLVRRARQDVTVVITGQGTDEPWGGYRRYQVEMLRRLFPFAAAWRLLGRIGACFPRLPERLERGLRTLPVGNIADRAVEACTLFPRIERLRLLGSDDDGGAARAMRYWFDWLRGCGCGDAEQVMRVDSRMNLADDLLLYGDKIAMAVSLEARVPMLDIELMRFVESLPVEYRIRLRQGKIAHKMMAERYLPRTIVHRPKKGFQVPFGAWSRGPWRQWVEVLLLDGLGDILSKDGVERLWRGHLCHGPDRSRQIFSLLMLALWRREADGQ